MPRRTRGSHSPDLRAGPEPEEVAFASGSDLRGRAEGRQPQGSASRFIEKMTATSDGGATVRLAAKRSRAARIARSPFLWLAIAFAVGAGTMIGLTKITPPKFAGLRVGQLAPPFVLKDLEGNSVGLGDFLGKPVFMNFYLTTCPSCRPELIGLTPLAEKGEVAVIAVNIGGERAEAVRAWARDPGYPFPLLLDSDARVPRLYKAREPPTSYLIDPSGRVITRFIGPTSEEAISRALTQWRERQGP